MHAYPGPRPRFYAHVRCLGGCYTPLRRLAKSFSSCAAAHAATPARICPAGCLGLGDCLGPCQHNALVMSPTGVVMVAADRCTGCGRCLAVCPRRLITLVGEGQRTSVSCRSSLSVPEQETFCPRGCDGCGRCLKVCPQAAVTIRAALATINRQRCNGCGLCAEWCPQQCIAFTSLGGRFAPSNPLAKQIP